MGHSLEMNIYFFFSPFQLICLFPHSFILPFYPFSLFCFSCHEATRISLHLYFNTWSEMAITGAAVISVDLIAHISQCNQGKTSYCDAAILCMPYVHVCVCVCLIFWSAVLVWVICEAGGVWANLLWAMAKTLSLSLSLSLSLLNTHT